MSSWEVRMSSTRQRPYYYNTETGEAIWEAPSNLTNEQIMALPGAHYLEADSAPSKVRASHLLVKHAMSRRPASWKDVSGRGGNDGAWEHGGAQYICPMLTSERSPIPSLPSLLPPACSRSMRIPRERTIVATTRHLRIYGL